MKSLKELTPHSFEAGLTPERVRPLQIIQAGLGMGILFLSGVVFFLAFNLTPEKPDANDFSLMQTLSIVHALLAVSIVTASGRLFEMQFSPEKIERAVENSVQGPDSRLSDDPIDQALALIRTAVILRLAMMEAIAVLGLVICIIGALNGTLAAAPEFAFNGLTPALFLVRLAVMFPNSQRIADIYRDKIASL